MISIGQTLTKNHAWFILLMFLSCWGCKSSQHDLNQGTIVKLDSLLNNWEVFSARRYFNQVKGELSVFDQLIIEARLGNVFNRPIESNLAIDKLYSDFEEDLTDSLKCVLMQIGLENDVKLFRYRQAATAGWKLMEEYTSYLDSSRLYEIKNEYAIWKALSGIPPQKMVKKARSTINLADGYKIPVGINGSDKLRHLIFDTGANLCVITESLAQYEGMDILNATCKVRGIMGNEVDARVAVASTLNFGNVVLANVVFLVIPDEFLYIPQANYQIWGIIGYPVISALKEVRLVKGSTLIIPAKLSTSTVQNLAMNFLTPLIEVECKGDTMVFAFDAGANKTWLYEKYYESKQIEIESKYELTEFTVAGIGQADTISGYYVNFNVKVGGQHLQLDSTRLFPNALTKDQQTYYGNLGLDVIRVFDTMTLSFDDMFVVFQ